MTARAAIGIDVGGTLTKAVVCDEDGRVLARHEARTPARGVGLVESLATVVQAVTGVTPAGVVPEPTVALCVPGIVDEARGIAVTATNLDWSDSPLAAQLAERLGRPALLGHDVRAGGTAELRWGAAQGETSVMFMAVGTGIATALVLDGRPVVTGGYAGETGHALVRDPVDGELVLMERVASAAAVARRWTARTGRPAAGSETVFAAAAAGDPAAAAVIGEAVDALAEVLACQLTLVGPVPLVLGGGLSRAGEALLVPLRETLTRRLVLHPPPPLRVARLGSWDGAMGSAAMALAGAGPEDVGPDTDATDEPGGAAR